MMNNRHGRLSPEPDDLAYLPDGFRGTGTGFLRAECSYLVQVIRIRDKLEDPFAKRGVKPDDILGKLFFHVTVPDSAPIVKLAEMIVGGSVGHHLHQAEKILHRL